MGMKQKRLWFIAFLTFIATIIRISDLTGRSMWLDDGYTLARIVAPWSSILSGVMPFLGSPYTDMHPPVFFVLLKTLSIFSGFSEYALKLFPVFWGILIVPLSFILAKRMFSYRAGAVAAILATLSPAYQWFSHDLRMYSMAICLTAFSTYCAYRWIEQRLAGQPSRWWMVWLAAAVVSLSTHYLLVSVVLLQALVILLAHLNTIRSPRLRKVSIITVVGTVIAGLIVSYVVLQLGKLTFSPPTPLLELTRYVLDGMLYGLNASDPTNSFICWSFAAVCLIGLYLTVKQRNQSRVYGAVLLFTVAVGVIILNNIAISLASFYIDIRYFVTASPALHVLFSIAIMRIWDLRNTNAAMANSKPIRLWVKWNLPVMAACVALAVAIMAHTHGLVWTFIRTPFWQDDWRSMAAYIRDNYRDGDVLLSSPNVPYESLKIYLSDVPITYLYTLEAHTNTASVKKPDRIWYARSVKADPRELDASIRRYYKRIRVGMNSRTDIIELYLYEVSAPLYASIPPSATVIPAEGNHDSSLPQMVAYEVQPGNRYNPLPNYLLSLYWRPGEASNENPYKLSVRIHSVDNASWADWFMPAGLNAAPEEWKGVRLFRVDYQVPIPVGLPSQPYSMQLDLRLGEKAEAVHTVTLPLTQEEVSCCLRLPNWQAFSKSASSSVQWQSSDVNLVKAEYNTAFRPGDIAPVNITWQLKHPANVEWHTTLELSGLTGGVVATTTSSASPVVPSVTKWSVGESVRTMYALKLPHGVQPGYYRLTIRRHSADDREIDGTTLGFVSVQDYPPAPLVTAIPNRVNGRAGAFTLMGYGIEQPVERNVTLAYHVYWRVDEKPDEDGILYLHVLTPDGKLVAQDDNPPESGKRSTLSYRSGDGIDQIHRIVLPADTPKGNYKLYVGIYNRDNKERWTTEQDGVVVPNKELHLGELVLP